MVTVELPAALRAFADGQSRVKVAADTVGLALEALCARHTALRAKLFTDAGSLKRSIGVFFDDEDVRDAPGTTLAARSVIVLVAAMAGG
ncbi:MAG: molybdopterin synthase sulfur carrier subunit [Archangium gephyra]|uniref:Molybdopterin synthase sulfur carrier subunit n=1 Tax=Archangium gephyra TaxID=48 RepID=A0A2W5VLA9_9BACT|nr:MAG: molybdopterin synthase sulfur carrier subunit [Archangium gephyra]